MSEVGDYVARARAAAGPDEARRCLDECLEILATTRAEPRHWCRLAGYYTELLDDPEAALACLDRALDTIEPSSEALLKYFLPTYLELGEEGTAWEMASHAEASGGLEPRRRSSGARVCMHRALSERARSGSGCNDRSKSTIPLARLALLITAATRDPHDARLPALCSRILEDEVRPSGLREEMWYRLIDEVLAPIPHFAPIAARLRGSP